MNEAEERARLEVAMCGIRYLIAQSAPSDIDKLNNEGKDVEPEEVPIPRTQLFQIPRPSSTDIDLKILGKAKESKHWQKAYVERMHAMRVIKKVQKGSSTLWLPDNWGFLEGIVRDWLDGHGEVISKIIFPDGMSILQLEAFCIKKIKVAKGEASEDTPADVVAGDDRVETVVRLAAEKSEVVDSISEQLFNVGEQLLLRIKDLYEAVAVNTREAKATQQEFNQLRAEVRRTDKSYTDLNSSIQGAIRAMNGSADVSADFKRVLVSIGELRLNQQTFTTDVTTLFNATKQHEVALSTLLDRTRIIQQHIENKEANQLSGAITTAEAALEALVDAAAESKHE